MFCRAMEHILELDADKTWDDVRATISDEQVQQIHQVVADLWPIDTNLSELLPRPRSDTFRAVYMGALEARSANSTVVGMLGFFDEIVIANPFQNPAILQPEFSPTKSPDSHKVNTVENVLLMLALWPFIAHGIVHVVPDIGDYDVEFARASMKAAEERTKGPDEVVAREDLRRMWSMKYKTLVALNRMPEGALAAHFRAEQRGASREEIEALVTAAKEMIADDPYAVLVPCADNKRGSFLVQKGFALESGMFFAALTGSVLFTDYHSLWQHAHRHATEHLGQTATDLRQIIRACQAIELPVDVSAELLFEARETGKSESLRAVMRDIISATRENFASVSVLELAGRLDRARETTNAQLAAMPGDVVARIQASFPLGGFHRAAIWRHLLTFGQAQNIAPIPAAFLVKFYAKPKTTGTGNTMLRQN
ncbi:hypothetical protein PAN31108_04893 [Pandoraea anhela]|uniref:Uncharacterized protein n=1 Tax=Pandoraea anhela TaxID=2508295 RepID=A0A5E4Z0R5_9BURK|nr:hypothetical protein PAN31108_04893 [Pandoraea anhela]